MNLWVYRVLLGVSVVVFFQANVRAQEDRAQSGETLPPLIVRPPAESAERQEDSTLESVEILSDPAAVSFPGLSEIQLGTDGPFGASRGILRGQRALLDTSSAVSIRTQEEILERQAPDVFHALQNEVGVLLQRTAAGQASPFIRGLTVQQVLILVDGIRLNNSIFRRGPNQYFNTLDPGMIDHI